MASDGEAATGGSSGQKDATCVRARETKRAPSQLAGCSAYFAVIAPLGVL